MPDSEQMRVPLCVDLDGTLIRTDILAESLVRLTKTRPFDLLRVPTWLIAGRAVLKAKLAERVRLDPSALPYEEALLDLMRRERGRGRPLILVTASHEGPARRVASHVGVFDDVLATADGHNLKGARKRDALVQRFGERGFDYAGNSAADLEVWKAARHAIAVNAPAGVLRRLSGREPTILSAPRRNLVRRLADGVRVRQWVKNLLVFVPLLLAHRYFEPGLLGRAALAFASFSLGCSAVYVFNDLMDVEADRHHPRKRRRPFASGELSAVQGMALVPILLAASVALALTLPVGFLASIVAYFVVTTLYSLTLKEIAVVDILTLASLYTVRILAGSAATGVLVSEWLLAFSVFVFLSLGALKRYAELRRVGAEATASDKVRGRGYFIDDADLVVQMGLSSGYIAVLVLALYLTGDDVAQLYARPPMLWLACPLVLYWISRTWLLAHRGAIEDDPVSFAVHDRTTWFVAALTALLLLAARRGA